MSGHSKWAQIKRQKGANDAKRGLTFTKLGNAISVAVRQGGGIGDPNQNFRLRLAIDAARGANMPKENIQRAIEKAMGKGEQVMEEALYEGFGPMGVSIMVETASDNKNRTSSEVKNIFEKNGGAMGQPGSVSYMFKHVGRIIVPKNGKTIDDIFLLSAEAGAEDVEDAGEDVFVTTTPSNLGKVKESLESLGLVATEAALIYQPSTFIEVNQQDSEKVLQFVEKLEELDDVQKVYANVSIN